MQEDRRRTVRRKGDGVTDFMVFLMIAVSTGVAYGLIWWLWEAL